MGSSNKITGEHILFERYYDLEDPLHLILIMNEYGIQLQYRDRLGSASRIPLAVDPHWNYRTRRLAAQGFAPSSPIRDISERLLHIADWLDANPEKTFGDYLMLIKLST